MAGRPRKPPATRKLPPEMERYKFKKGVTGNPKGRPRKKPFSDMLLNLIEQPAPREFFGEVDVLGRLNDPLNRYKGKRLTIGALIALRMAYSAATGTKNPGLKDAMEIINRCEGKVPLPVVSREVDRDEFIGLTEKELDERLVELTQQIKLLTAAEDDEG